MKRTKAAGRSARATRLVLVSIAALAVPSVHGAELVDSEKVRLAWDTTVSWGTLFRVEDKDQNLISFAQGGRAWSANVDDGNINYDTGMASNVFSLTSEIQFEYSDWFGIFVRGRSFYDLENEDNERDRTPLSEAALKRVGNRTELLDAFVKFRFDLGRVPVEIRVGDQVVSWGESTFIPGGINTINPVDVAALRSPGSELRNAFLPEGIAWLSLGMSQNTNLELLYQYDWDDTEIDPAGSFFSSSDFIGDGGERVFLGFGEVFDLGTFLPPNLGGFNPTFLSVRRANDRFPDDGGQYGAAIRVFAPSLNDTEFGFYFLNYHSRVPVLSGLTGTARGRRDADDAFRFLIRFIPINQAIPVALDEYARTTRYFAEYPEDIKLYGLSFNAQAGETALQGEISRRKDVPFQIDDNELFFAALSPLNFQAAFKDNQLGTFAVNQEITGFIRRDYTQMQATATRVLGPLAGANTSVLVGEAAYARVHGMPEKSVLRLEAPGTFVSGNPNQASAPGVFFPLGGVHTGKEAEPFDTFPDANSWGYRLAGRLEYLNAIGPVNLLPRFSWQHDVSGTTPGPGGNFIEGRKALTVGVTGTYLESWEGDISYTTFGGAGKQNLINDRDFVSVTLKYSF